MHSELSVRPHHHHSGESIIVSKINHILDNRSYSEMRP